MPQMVPEDSTMFFNGKQTQELLAILEDYKIGNITFNQAYEALKRWKDEK